MIGFICFNARIERLSRGKPYVYVLRTYFLPFTQGTLKFRVDCHSEETRASSLIVIEVPVVLLQQKS